MELSSKQKNGVKTAFESILRADYININEIDQLKDLGTYYIDTFNNVGNLLQKQDNYISGRRGTGKTALLLRGYYECLKTISSKVTEKSNCFENEKILPLYIDLSNCSEIFSSNYSLNHVEMYFVKQIIESLKSQLELMFDEKVLMIFKKENPALDDLEYIEKALINGLALQNSMTIKMDNKSKTISKAELGYDASLTNIGTKGSITDTQELNNSTSYDQIRGLDIQCFLNKINQIRSKAKIDYIFVFLDEFSDLNEKEQNCLSDLIKKFLGSKINMYFKIGVITDRYNFGEHIRIGRDLFPIPLDLNEFVERYGGLAPTLRKMQQFMEQLVNKRLELYCPDVNYDDIFEPKMDVVFTRIAREAMGVPRSIGLILQHAWSQTMISEKKIGLQEINYGIRATRKTYSLQFTGAIKSRLIPGFYMDLWSDILQKACIEKQKKQERPASHVMIDPLRKNYINIFCEYFLMHFLEESRSSKYGGNYSLYCIDYGICLENNIKFAEEKDEFTAVRFIYDPILSKYDGYFVKDRIKSYKCEECGRIYEEEEVSQIKTKRCFDDDTLLVEIIHKEAPRSDGNYAEVEIKILGYISELNADDAQSAQEIADAVGCSRQKVSNWGSKVLYKKGQINIIQKDGKNYYFGCEEN
jgi:Cdc6-like AAA superfamily ATPase